MKTIIKLLSIVVAAHLYLFPGLAQTITIDKNQTYQTIDGFGFFGAYDVWWSSSDPQHFVNDAWLTDIVTDLGITIWRNEWYPPADEWNNQDADWNQQKAIVKALKDKADDNGVDLKFIITIWTPPAAMKWDASMSWAGDKEATRGPGSNGAYYTKNGGTLNPDKYGAYADFLKNCIKSHKDDAGVDVYALSLQNEPLFSQSYNSCVYTTHWYVDLLNNVVPEIKSTYPNLKIYGSENMLEMEGLSNNYPWFYHKAIKDDASATANINILAVHGYSDGVSASSSSKLAEAWTNHKEQFSEPMKKPAWMTETSGYVDSWDPTDKKGAFVLANDIYSALAYGDASAWVWWQGCGGTGTPGEYELMSKDYKGKKYYASKMFYRYIRPGAKRIAASSDDTEVASLAFHHQENGTHTILLINKATNSKNVTITMNGNNLPSSFEKFVTSASENCTSFGQVSASAGIELPGRSVVVLQAGGNPLTGISKPDRHLSSGETSKVELYPNPAKEVVTIAMDGGFVNQPVAVELSNHFGQVVSSINIEKNTNLIRLNTASLPPGIYFVSIDYQGKKLVKKLIKFGH